MRNMCDENKLVECRNVHNNINNSDESDCSTNERSTSHDDIRSITKTTKSYGLTTIDLKLIPLGIKSTLIKLDNSNVKYKYRLSKGEKKSSKTKQQKEIIHTSSRVTSRNNSVCSLFDENDPIVQTNDFPNLLDLGDDINNLELLENEIFNSSRDSFEKICAFEISTLEVSFTLKYRDNERNSLFHQLARYQTIKHKITEYTKKIIEINLPIDENGLVDMDTFCFTRALVSRIKREEKKNYFKNNPSLKNVINEPNQNYCSPLTIAIEEDRLDMLQLFFPYASFETLKEPFGHTALHIACWKGSYKCFKFLMDQYYLSGQNVSQINLKDLYGNTALALAIRFYSSKKSTDYNKIIFELIKCRYVNLRIRNKDNDSLAHLVTKSEQCDPYEKVNILRALNLNANDIMCDRDIYGQSIYDCWNMIPINQTISNASLCSLLAASSAHI